MHEQTHLVELSVAYLPMTICLDRAASSDCLSSREVMILASAAGLPCSNVGSVQRQRCCSLRAGVLASKSLNPELVNPDETVGISPRLAVP